jgi:pimeloyl-ACP methyl ester carboxylesterase
MHTIDGYIDAEDGVRLFYKAVGSGSNVVIVPNGTYLREDFDALATGRLVVFFDPRNRGRSDATGRGSGGGILQDVKDVHDVATHFSRDPVTIIGHSFAGVLAALYAKSYSHHVRRVVQIGPMALNPDRQFPAPLVNQDETFARVMTALGSLLQERAAYEPEAFCEKVWSVLRALYVTSEADAFRITWGRCSLPNERNGMRYFSEETLPSIRSLALTATDFITVEAPVLVVHGTKDRSAPYGGGREWAITLPNARLVSVEGGGHAPWIEAPRLVFDAIETFLRGEWHASAERVTSLVPEET